MTTQEYLNLLIPLIITALTVGVPGVIALYKMLKQDKVDNSSVANQQVGTSLDLVEKLKDQYESVLLRLEKSESLNEQRDIRIRDLEEAARIDRVNLDENKRTIEKLYFEQNVSTAHINHLIGIIRIYAQQMAEVNIIPLCTPKTRKEIEAEVLAESKQ